jgi:YbbR domain-containing protein
MSERSDALVLVVSEETGTISAAEAGQLEVLEGDTALRERILQFARGRAKSPRQKAGLDAVFEPGTRRLRSSFARRARSVAGRLALAVLFALATWGYVLITTRSLPDTQVNDVRLEMVDLPQGMTVANELPQAVDLVVRTPREQQAGLDDAAFGATLPLSGLEAGLHQVQVEIEPRTNMPVHVIDIQPEVVDVNLAPVGRREVTVTLALEEESQLPAAYEVQDEPVISPTMVLVEGPQDLVEQVAGVQVTLPLTDTQGLVEDVQPVVAVDEDGNPIEDVVMRPEEVEVRVTVGRRADVREVGVAVVTEGTPAAGYWVSGLSSDPASVILSGPPQILGSIDSVVSTTPVPIDGAAGDVLVQASLDLPPEVTARTPEGEDLSVVQVQVRVSARRGSSTLTRPVELMAEGDANLSVQPEQVELLLSGPLPTLQEIEERPELVRVVLRVEEEEVAAGESVELALRVIAPAGINVQLVTPTATVTRR